MQRFNETKANASRIEIFMLLGFFLIGSAGFFLSLTSLDMNEQDMNIKDPEFMERQAFLSKSEYTGLHKWNTYEINDFEISAETEIIISPQTPVKIYANNTIGLYFKKRGAYEIKFKNKKDQRIIFREYISL
ncbi:MAG: hypothetical protein RLZZ417_1321 [Bacteroidota bacterium]|jgi:hypothetical protein